MSQAAAAREFPRRSAVTRRFTLGAPRSFAVSPDGARVAFLRSARGDDPAQALWVLECGTGEERRVADPAALGIAEGDLPPEERARRERAREQAGGIVRFATDRAVTRATFAVGGAAFVVDLTGGEVVPLALPGPVVDPRVDPTGTRLAWVTDRSLALARLDAPEPATLAAEERTTVTWGLPEFIAAEEMGRSRGFWWAPDGLHLLAARVDDAPVARWHIAEPADPAAEPQTVRFPAAGQANADVTLALFDLDGTRTDVDWDRAGHPYLTRAFWQAGHPPTIAVQRRDQRSIEVHTIDAATGTTAPVACLEGDPWLEIVPGTPRWVEGGLLTAVEDLGAGPYGTRRLAVDGAPVSPAGLHVHEVAGSAEGSVLVVASSTDPGERGVWRIPLDGGEPARLDDGGGVASVAGRPGAFVLTQSRLDTGAASAAHTRGRRRPIASVAEDPALRPRPDILALGPEALPAALVIPSGHDPGDGPLPVLLDPYGGPHAQRVLRSRNAFLTPQWFAEAGFAVLVVDGRGTPGRGPAWEHAVAGDLASAPLADQVEGLHAAAKERPGLLDLDRVAIRGWSFGGYLAALAVLRRPDVFHAAVAGAPVTDWRLYDTHYTERYLGDPDGRPSAYEQSSLLGDAHRLVRPLLMIHGLADDNVVAAHTLRLSRALVENGRPHSVLPLSGVTHMTPQEVVAEHLLTLQVAFLRAALGLDGTGSRTGGER